MSRPPARRRTLRPVFADDRGQNLVEFAILAPIFLFLLIGMFEFGRAWNIYQVVVNAAREGGRVAALPTGFSTADSVQARVASYLQSANLNPGVAEVLLQDVEGATGSIASVSVSYPYSFAFVGPIARLVDSGSTLGGDLTLSSTAQMRNE
ncbi:MAG: TadE/TadG family type IV pilus assembly protein [Gemmatimonadota bacterium]